jgi:hypothetical protein
VGVLRRPRVRAQRKVVSVMAAACCAVGLQTVTASSNAPTKTLLSPIVVENARTGTRDWLMRPIAPPTAIEAYSQPTVGHGDELQFHVNAKPSTRYRIAIYRLGWYNGRGARLVVCKPSCSGSHPGLSVHSAQADPITGKLDAEWPVTDIIPVGNWPSGYYLGEAVLTTGPLSGAAARVPFVVRAAARARPSKALVVAATNTWEAYNAWGGKSLYPNSSTDGMKADKVSFNRPYGAGAQSPFYVEYQLAQFLESYGFDVSYATDLDVDRDPGILQRHELVIVAGHDEYWSKAMRDGYEAARDAGTNLVFMGANIGYWQMRYENDRQTIVEYKGVRVDPSTDPATKSARFRDLPTPRPECQLLGVESDSTLAQPADPPRNYVVTDAGAKAMWAAGTGLHAGDVLPAAVGYEWDYVHTGCTPAGTNFQTLFHYDGLPGPGDSVSYIAPSGSVVFSLGTMEAIWSLDNWGHTTHPIDPRFQRYIANLIRQLTRP